MSLIFLLDLVNIGKQHEEIKFITYMYLDISKLCFWSCTWFDSDQM